MHSTRIAKSFNRELNPLYSIGSVTKAYKRASKEKQCGTAGSVIGYFDGTSIPGENGYF